MLFPILHLITIIIVAVKEFWRKRGSTKREVKLCRGDVSVITDHLPNLNKQMNHLVILANTEHHCLSDLARIVVWSLVAKVSYVSFYDVTGCLGRNKQKLLLEIDRHKKDIPGYIKWAAKSGPNGFTNGLKTHTVVVNILNLEDGRAKIVQCITEMASERARISQNCAAITVQELDTRLASLYPSVSDPDVVFYTGPLVSTYGLLPWQIRYTEFVQLSVDHKVNITRFVKAMYKYNERIQRHGQ